MNFAVSPPEINSARIFGGAGPGPLLAAAAAWDVLADELGSAATAFSSVTSGLANASWQGAASAAMVDVAGRYMDWLAATGVLAEQAAGQARMTATAFEATLAASVHPVSVIANRSQMVALVTSNLLGLNAPAIAAVDAEYEQMWAQDVAAMFGYHAEASVVVSALSPFTELLQLPSAAVSGFVVSTQAAIADPPGRVSILAAGLANVGGSNVGAGNVGDANVGFGNRGVWNLGLGSVGSFNLGSGNVGGHNVGWSNLGSLNVGFGNQGDSNFGFGNSGWGNVGFGNSGSNNVGIGLTGDHQVGFGAWNSGSGNVGLFNSGAGNVGFFNSGTGNYGIGNSGSFNSGIGNSGVANTGVFNAGGFNTGWANAGSYNTGGFNAGDFNSGSANPGDVNTGSFNTGDTNTGWANTGNLDTGAFISGDQSNGLLWRGDRQGLIAADYTLTIPDIPLTLAGGGLIKLPVTGNIAGLTVNPFTIHGVDGGAIPVNFDIVVDAKTDGFDLVIPLPDPFPNIHVPVSGLPISLAIPLRSALDPIQVPQIQFGAIPLNLTVGSDTTLLTIGLTGGSGPIAVPVSQLLPMTGIGNSTTAPSSGFFNSGAGGTSGFGNIGDIISGVFNVGSHISGFENYGGELLSGLTNLGSAMSGFGNTSSLDIAIAGLISGVGNIGNRLSGIFLQGSVP